MVLFISNFWSRYNSFVSRPFLFCEIFFVCHFWYIWCWVFGWKCIPQWKHSSSGKAQSILWKPNFTFSSQEAPWWRVRISCINKLISSYTSGAIRVEYQVKVQTWNGKYTTITNISHCLPSGELGRHQWPLITFFFSFEIIVSLRILPNTETYPIANIDIPDMDMMRAQRKKQLTPSRSTSLRELILI